MNIVKGLWTDLDPAWPSQVTTLVARSKETLDDGWPESVEEQGLLLLVWRHNITNNILKRCVIGSREEEYQDKIAEVKDNSLHRKHFYTQKLLHKAFTHKSFYTQKFLHTETFTHKSLHTHRSFCRHFHTQTLLHTDVCTHKSFYTQKLLHTDACTQTLLHAKFLPTKAFTDRNFYTQTLLHRCFYT